MATQYFGPQTDSATDSNSPVETDWTTSGYVCPGTGNQTVVELSALVYGSITQMRLALFDSTGTVLICQGLAAVTLAGSSLTWQGHLAQSAITPNPATLTGGTSYIIARCCNGAMHYGYSGSSGTSYNSSDYTSSGYSNSSLSSPGSTGELMCMRCGVVAAGGGGNWLEEGYWWNRPYQKYFDMNSGNWRKQNGIYVKG